MGWYNGRVGRDRMMNRWERIQRLERLCEEAADKGDIDELEQLRCELLSELSALPGGRISEEVQHREEERWYRRAAEAGSLAAMARLGSFLERRGYIDEAVRWLVTASDGGSVEAMTTLVWMQRIYGTRRDQELWYRKAIDAGSLDLLVVFAAFLQGEDRFSEAETWLLKAIEEGFVEAMVSLGGLLERQGRDVEAERWLHAAIDAGSVDARGDLVEMLMRQGRTAEAESLSRRYGFREDRADRYAGLPADWGTVAMTAAITAAVVPFIHTLATKAAEDSYAAVRAMISRLVRRHRTEERASGGTPGSVLRVTDPDTGVVLELRSDITDEALEALAELDVGAAGMLRVAWNDELRRWEVTTPSGRN
jgi:TPR repeat protein